ncbi:MAG TPA: cytochrome c peroxidase [Steroidobacteraceae bacterium]|nr:cytochrome c peroxidase [Steroidobacteraceae bacterium]
MSAAKVALGRRLFAEDRLSVTGHYSCASCHRPDHSYTDGRPVAVGATGAKLTRRTLPLVNVAYNISFGWQHPEVKSLEQQMLQPLYNQHPVELGLTGRETAVARELAADPSYVAQFAAAFPEADARGAGANPAGGSTAGSHGATPARVTAAITIPNVIKAIAAFERTLIFGDSPFDRYVFGGDSNALSPAAKRGMKLFFSKRLGCGGCHSGINFAGNWRDSQGETGPASFADDGTGVVVKVPTLRNVGLTGPYLHDGRLATLEDVVKHYEEMGASTARGSTARREARSGTAGDRRLAQFTLARRDTADLVSFLRCLAD